VPGKFYFSAKAITTDTVAQIILSIGNDPNRYYAWTLADTIDLSAYQSKQLDISVTARNSRQQSVTVYAWGVYVDSTSALVPLSLHKGNILDFNSKYILSGERESLWVYDRATSLVRGLAFPLPFWRSGDAFLTPNGFVVEASESMYVYPSHERIYEWDGTALTLLGEFLSTQFLDFRAAGDFVIWGGGDPGPAVFVRKNVVTGDTVSFGFGADVGNIDNSLAPNGNYAFWTSSDSNIYLYDGGVRRITNNVAGQWCLYPVTDGTLIAFRKRLQADGLSSIVLYDGSGETVLSTGLYDPRPAVSYSAAFGYVAFAKPSALGDINLWLRRPDGSMSQKTFFGSLRTPGIDHLMADRSLVIRSGSSIIPSERSVIDSSGSRRVLCSGLGKAARIDGTWYVAIGRSFLRIEEPPVSVEPDRAEGGIPMRFNLAQNYPNPFNPTTTITYELPATSHVTLKIFDLLGREVIVLEDRVVLPGKYAVTWDASRCASGVYFFRLQASAGSGRAPSYTSTKQMILLK